MHRSISGLNGDYNWGNIIKTGFSAVQYQQLRLASQATFTTPIAAFAPTFVPNLAAIPVGQAGLFLVGVPEPVALGLIVPGLAVLSVTRRPRRQVVRS